MESKKITIAVHQENRPAKFYIFNDKLLKIFLLSFSALVITVLTVALGYSIFLHEKVRNKKEQVPRQIIQLNQKVAELQASLSSEQAITKTLQKKLSSKGQSQGTTYSLLTHPSGMLDLRASSRVDISEVEIEEGSTTRKVSFKINNKSKNNEKLTGYLYVYQVSKDNIRSYPKKGFSGSEYTNGESFVISSFKPVSLSFPRTKDFTGFHIVIYTRGGDLILAQKIEQDL